MCVYFSDEIFPFVFFVHRQSINQQFQRIETGVDNTLVLRNVQRHHEGNYTCNLIAYFLYIYTQRYDNDFIFIT